MKHVQNLRKRAGRAQLAIEFDEPINGEPNDSAPCWIEDLAYENSKDDTVLMETSYYARTKDHQFDDAEESDENDTSSSSSHAIITKFTGEYSNYESINFIVDSGATEHMVNDKR